MHAADFHPQEIYACITLQIMCIKPLPLSILARKNPVWLRDKGRKKQREGSAFGWIRSFHKVETCLFEKNKEQTCLWLLPFLYLFSRLKPENVKKVVLNYIIRWPSAFGWIGGFCLKATSLLLHPLHSFLFSIRNIRKYLDTVILISFFK